MSKKEQVPILTKLAQNGKVAKWRKISAQMAKLPNVGESGQPGRIAIMTKVAKSDKFSEKSKVAKFA